MSETTITSETVCQTDARLASVHELPEIDGFQTLGFEQQEAVLDWIRSHCLPGECLTRNTSKNIAYYCNKAMKDAGYRKHVGNLAMKTALALLGYKASVPCAVEIQYYRIKLSKKPVERKEDD